MSLNVLYRNISTVVLFAVDSQRCHILSFELIKYIQHHNGKCQDRNRIVLNASSLLQAIDPLHNMYFLHSSSSMPFRTVKSSTCKTKAQVIGLKLINSPWLSVSVCLSAISQLSDANNKTTQTPCLCITLRVKSKTWLSLLVQKECCKAAHKQEIIKWITVKKRVTEALRRSLWLKK